MSTLLRAVRWLLLGGWLGSWALFALDVAPTAFRVLPGDQAGTLVAPLLRDLHLYGIAAGILLCAIAFAKREPTALRLLPLVLAALCAISEFAITSAIDPIRPSGFGPGTPADAALRFGRLHFASRLVFGVVLLGTALLSILHATRESNRNSRSFE